ncbi:MAG: UDP-glucose 4-epimerase [Ramlibacter sp.]|nr:UDP-glucose 4-epimerase [Ramlibacter sp.]
MRVLITGGMGVMGAEASRKFVDEGNRPVIYARHHDDTLIHDIVDKVDIELGDVLDLPKLLGVMKKHRITHIVHTAAFVGALSQANPAQSVQVNVVGTTNVLEAARLFDVERVVFTSAKGVYGKFLGEYGHPVYTPVPENHVKNPVRIYDSAKLMGEQLVLYYNDHMGVDGVVLRFGTTYGPGKTSRHGKMGATSQIVEDPFNGLPFNMEAGGDQKDDLLYNKDSAQGIYKACIAKNLRDRVFNIGTGVGSTMHDFSNAIRRRLPGADIRIGPGLNYLGMPHPVYAVYDISKACEQLDFKPEFDVDRGVADYLESLAAMRARNA